MKSPMIGRLLPGLLCALSFVAFTSSANAQAKIDPSLPEAPLPHRRVLLLFPGFETVQDPTIPVAPLKPKQKFEMAYRKTVDPSFLIESAAFAGLDQGIGYGPQYGSGWGPYAQRFGYNAANLATTFLFTDAILPNVFHQDPRYFRKGTGSFVSRVWWALRSEAVAYSDQGNEMPNYSSMIGFGMSTALSNAYSPESSITFGKTMERYGVKEGVSFGLNILREFGGLSKPEKHQE
ncbi:MAG: hypothetical protein HIU93_06560 [Acidobacteria bacterium]|nr:hypothetical protein [Acidobacteriota bacterium]MBW4045116.1 hypothetical protein [Acidobacteriota bacterium]